MVFVAGHVPVAILPVKSMRMREKKAWVSSMARCRFLERIGSGCGQQLLPKIAREGAVMGSSELTNADKGRYISFVGVVA